MAEKIECGAPIGLNIGVFGTEDRLIVGRDAYVDEYKVDGGELKLVHTKDVIIDRSKECVGCGSVQFDNNNRCIYCDRER